MKYSKGSSNQLLFQVRKLYSNQYYVNLLFRNQCCIEKIFKDHQRVSVLKCFRVLLKRKEKHMKMENENFCLQWTDFESNTSIAFRELREEKDFFDVTLVCNEGQTQAHKVFTLCPIYTSPLQIQGVFICSYSKCVRSF